MCVCVCVCVYVASTTIQSRCMCMRAYLSACLDMSVFSMPRCVPK